MTREQALTIVAYLNAGFPREALEETTIDVYAAEVGLLVDGQVGLEAAQRTVREAERFPSISEFRRTYRAVAEARKADMPALPEGPRFVEVPEWVHVWWWARRTRGEGRAFPEQDEHGQPGVASLSLREYGELVGEWRAAGAPTVTAGQVAA